MTWGGRGGGKGKGDDLGGPRIIKKKTNHKISEDHLLCTKFKKPAFSSNHHDNVLHKKSYYPTFSWPKPEAHKVYLKCQSFWDKYGQLYLLLTRDHVNLCCPIEAYNVKGHIHHLSSFIKLDIHYSSLPLTSNPSVNHVHKIKRMIGSKHKYAARS